MALWGGRFSKNADRQLADFSESISYDQRLYKVDIAGSTAHVRMLEVIGIVTPDEADAITEELANIRGRIDAGEFAFRTELEDIHMNIESALIDALGNVGAKVHTGRSRNDQIATDERLYMRDEIDAICTFIRDLQKALVTLADGNAVAILPGLTHLQNAQPVLFAHHLLAFVEMFERDFERLCDCRKRVNRLPLGSGAIAGTTLPLQRELVAESLGFDCVLRNSMDGVADRDYIIEFLATLSILVMHTSRLAEDIILWVSQRFGYLELDDAFCTGSSLMPQKKNPDVAELTRGKTGRVYGSLISMLTTLKGLPMTYNRDLQEDKEPLFDAIDTVKAILGTLAPMMATARANPQAMLNAASDPALMATDLAEWLVLQGVPFREAHHQVGRLVGYCAGKDIALNAVPLDEMRESIPLANEECLGLFSPEKSVEGRDLTGGTAPKQVRKQLDFWIGELES